MEQYNGSLLLECALKPINLMAYGCERSTQFGWQFVVTWCLFRPPSNACSDTDNCVNPYRIKVKGPMYKPLLTDKKKFAYAIGLLNLNPM